MKSAPLHILAVVFLFACASWSALPDSLLPPGGFKSQSSTSDPEATMRLGKGLMLGGVGMVIVGGGILAAEVTNAAGKNAECKLKDDPGTCSSQHEASSLGPALMVGGVIALPLGALIALLSRDDSGRNPQYYGSIHPRRLEAGFRRTF